MPYYRVKWRCKGVALPRQVNMALAYVPENLSASAGEGVDTWRQ
jgi:hypothetical protein